MDLSIIIPTLNEAGEIKATLEKLHDALDGSSFEAEVLVVDGGSSDGTCELVGRAGTVALIRSEPGRARQMNAGARDARGETLFFLHADTHVPPEALGDLAEVVRSRADTVSCFHLKFRGPEEHYRTMERGVAWRCRAFDFPYGDQGLVIGRERFRILGGFDESAMLEDIEFVLRLRSQGERIDVLPSSVSTSVRQWERQGVVWGITYNLARMALAVMLFFFEGAGSNKAVAANEGALSVTHET